MKRSTRRVRSALRLVALLAVVTAGPGLTQEKDQTRPVTETGAKGQDAAAELRGAVERFLKAADAADAATVLAAYDPEFTCARVADEGGFVHLTRAQMAQFWNPPGGPKIPTKDTRVHHAEVVGETGFVLLTRTKDLGSGWEPMFYTLVWRRQGGEWRLLREFVHQRTMPRGR